MTRSIIQTLLLLSVFLFSGIVFAHDQEAFPEPIVGGGAPPPSPVWSIYDLRGGLFPGPQEQYPCTVADTGNLTQPDETLVPPRGPRGISGSGAGEVPVYDNDVNENLTRLIDLLRGSAGEASVFAENEQENTRSRVLLQLLCEKEFEEDHTNQHAWRQIIDGFVEVTYNFVYAGYVGNPIFLQNQQVYYENIDDEILITFLKELDVSNIGSETKRAMIAQLLHNRFTTLFPYDPENVRPTLSPDGVTDGLTAGFIENGGWEILRAQSEGCNSTQKCIDSAKAEFQKRREQQRAFEQEKLAWGRGFFSYEFCNDGDGDSDLVGDQGIYSDIREDRRNCFIVTPGSLIQDQVTHVFGSALRQMELNDEYEEWIGAKSLAVLGSAVSDMGIDPVFDTTNYGTYADPIPGGRLLNPEEARIEIRDAINGYTRTRNVGLGSFGVDDLVPVELNSYVNPGVTTGAQRDAGFIQNVIDAQLQAITAPNTPSI